jgi:hypothetical protein
MQTIGLKTNSNSKGDHQPLLVGKISVTTDLFVISLVYKSKYKNKEAFDRNYKKNWLPFSKFLESKYQE